MTTGGSPAPGSPVRDAADGPDGEVTVHAFGEAALLVDLPDLAAVREWGEKRLARYALPRTFAVVPELPRSQIGKVLRRVVREDLLGRDDVEHHRS